MICRTVVINAPIVVSRIEADRYRSLRYQWLSRIAFWTRPLAEPYYRLIAVEINQTLSLTRSLNRDQSEYYVMNIRIFVHVFYGFYRLPSSAFINLPTFTIRLIYHRGILNAEASSKLIKLLEFESLEFVIIWS